MKKFIKILFYIFCFSALIYYYICSNANALFIYAVEHDSVPLIRLAILCEADAKSILKDHEDGKCKMKIYPNQNIIEFLIKSYPHDLYAYDILAEALKDNSRENVKILLDNCDFNNVMEFSFYNDDIYCAKDPEILKLLDAHGFNISETVIKKIYNKKFPEIKDVLEKTKKINVKNKIGLTPLMCSIINRDHDAFNFLISNKADVNAEYVDGDTPLFMALRNTPDFGMTKILIEKGAKIDIENQLNECPLELLMDRSGNEELIKLLVEKGVSNKNKISAIARSKRTGLFGYASIIGEIPPPNDIKVPTEIHAPISLATNKIVDVNKKDNNGKTALSYAVESSSLENVKALIEKGADINITDSLENTLLMKAAELKNLKLVLLLTDCGADVNAKNCSGETALVKLIKNCRYIDVSLVKCLLQAGTDVNIKNSAGMDVLQYLWGKNIMSDSEQLKISNLFFKKYKTPASRELYKKRELIGYKKIKFEDMKAIAYSAVKDNNLESLEIYLSSLLSLEDFNNIFLIACKNNNLEIIKFLIENYEDIIFQSYDIQHFISKVISERYDRRILSYLLKQTNHAEEEQINLAVINNDIEALGLLIDKSFENYQYNCNIKNPIMLAVELENQEAVKILVKRMEDKDVEATYFDYRSNDNKIFNPMLSTNSLYRSIIKGQSGITKIFIDNLKNINKKFRYGFTALSYAAWYGKNDLVSHILNKGADPDLGTDDGTTPLMYASIAGHTEAIELLIKGKADINKKNTNGINALCEAMTSCRTEAVELLKSKGANLNEALNILEKIRKKGSNINSKDYFGNSMLAKAAFEKDFLKAKYLIDHGAKANDFTGRKTTILGAAVIYAGEMTTFSYELFKLLIDKGADPYYMNNSYAFAEMIKHSIIYGYDPIKNLLINRPSSFNISNMHSLLDDAIENGKSDWAEQLISAGINLDKKITRGYNNYSEPLFFSTVRNNDHNMLERLINKGIDVNTRALKNYSPWELQEGHHSAKLCDSLYYHDGNVTIGVGGYRLCDMPGCGGNALFFISDRTRNQLTADADNVKMLEMLVKAGCEINGRNDFGYTPLSIISMWADQKLTKAMIDHGADINAMSTDELKITPIFGACANESHPDVINVLLDMGADVNQTAQEKWTPLMFAVRAKNIRGVELLIQRGARINATNSEGMTALDIAYLYCYWKDEKNLNIVEKLKSAGAVSNYKKYDFVKVFN